VLDVDAGRLPKLQLCEVRAAPVAARDEGYAGHLYLAVATSPLPKLEVSSQVPTAVSGEAAALLRDRTSFLARCALSIRRWVFVAKSP
jgi:hypothetical protein